MRRKSLKLFLCGAAVFTAAVVGVQPESARADMGNYNFVSIDLGVVDSITVNGITVEALYRPYDSSVDKDATYSCAAFVKRFYQDVYGIHVYDLVYTTSTPQMDGGTFEAVSSPQVGDIIRDNVSVHWAIVKEVNGNTVTVIQQNAWNTDRTSAWVGATIEIGDPRFTFFRMAGNTGTAAPEGNYTIWYDATQVQETNATVSAQVDNPNGVYVSQVGISLWDGSGNLLTKYTEDCQRPESRFNMWYDIQNELGITLEPGNTYTYQFYVVHNGQEYPGSTESFTTAGAAYNGDAWSDTHDTAPMPEEEMTADDIIGTWVYEPDSLEPSVIEIEQEGDQLKYRYYRIVPGNAFGIGWTKEYTEWEYCTGKVNMYGIAAQFDCMVGDTDRKIYTSYYYDEVNDQIADQEDGSIFYHMNDYVYDNNVF